MFVQLEHWCLCYPKICVHGGAVGETRGTNYPCVLPIAETFGQGAPRNQGRPPSTLRLHTGEVEHGNQYAAQFNGFVEVLEGNLRFNDVDIACTLNDLSAVVR